MTVPYQSQETITVKPGEWHDVLWHQYMNCVDSLRSQNASTVASHGVSNFESYPSWESFEGNVVILEAMCDGYGLLDPDYIALAPAEVPLIRPESKSTKTPEKERDLRKVFAALTDLLKRKGVWKEARPYLGRI